MLMKADKFISVIVVISVSVVISVLTQQDAIMSYYRNAIWFVKGLQEYTRSGYEAAAKRFVASDLDVDLSSRSFIITGANSGIGKATALEIAKRGGTVHLVCRNKDRADEARTHIVEQSKNEKVHVHIVDISSPKALWEFASSFTQRHSVDVLINNAGCMVNQREVTEDGLEKNFATNTLGTFILSTALFPELKKSQDPRVITVSSGGMLVQKLNVDDLQFEKGTFDGTMAYAQNKRQQVIMTELWAQQHKEIHFSSMHPGWADTPAVQSSMPDFHAKMKNKLRTEAQGADTVVWLAVADAAVKHPSGLFFQDRTPVATHLPLALSRSSLSEENELMKTLEQLGERFKPRLTSGL
ncbi:dehydrogenase/reductase SDR family member 12 isoform X1 [Tachysurus fulvidraco]|uniref:dehydrogenase/reductase SDR family member 12 isoform X1 n=1 Tax=Tachysurus fulvidraco TaxID=1234273 RepID=UPI000F4F5539|nr:dehydrogenase/reductase SDR family member 12 isoform X1 [Tachysurus fulvidraco]